MKRAALSLLLALVALTLAYATSRPTPRSGAQTLSEPLGRAQPAQLEVYVSAADMRVDTRAAPGHLFDARVTAAAGRLVRRPGTGGAAGPAVYDLQAPARHALSLGWQNPRNVDLDLNRNVATELTLVSNVGEMSLNLREAFLRRLALQSQAGDIRVTLPARGPYAARITSQLGNVEVVLPAGLAAQVTVRRRLGDLTMPEGFARRGDVYTSAGYAQAAQRMDLTIEANLGDVAVSMEGE